MRPLAAPLLLLCACGPVAPQDRDDADTSDAPDPTATPTTAPTTGVSSDSITGVSPDSTTGVSSDSTTGDTTGITASDDSTSDARCIEERYPAEQGDLNPDWRLECGGPILCPNIDDLQFWLDGELAAPTAASTSDPGRARCIVEALRDRTLGQFDVSVLLTLDPQSALLHSVISLEILGEQAIARSEPWQCSLLPSCDAHEALHDLRPPAFFAACVDGDPLTLWTCIADAIDPLCQPGPLPCP